MSVQPKKSTQLGPSLGTSRVWRRRLLFHHLPLATLSALVLVLFMSLPLFDTTGSPTFDMQSSAAFPQPRGERGPTEGGGHGESDTRSTDHGDGRTGSVDGAEDHGGGEKCQVGSRDTPSESDSLATEDRIA